MYNVSAAYLEKINSVSRQVYWYGTVTLTNGTVYTFDVSNLKQGQNSLNKQLCADRKIQIGCTCSAELKLAFMLDYDSVHNTYSMNGIPVDKYDFYDATIVLYFRLHLTNNTYEDVNCGTYIVSEPERSQSVLICTAYDYMQKFSKSVVSTIQGQPYNVLLSACNVCGVQLGSTPSDIRRMVNGQKVCAEYDPKNQLKTWRDVIGYVACMLGGNAVIKSDNKLYIIPYSEGSIRTISSANRFNLTLADYITNYNILTAINLRTNVEEKAKVSDEGLTYAIGGNPLMQYTIANDRKTALANILYVLNRMKYVPFKGTFYADPSFELGDVITFTDNHAGAATLSVITEITLNIGSHMEMSCDGENPYRQKAEEAASSSYAEETNGSVGDGVSFYDNWNHLDVDAAANVETTVMEILYPSNGAYRNELGGEIKLVVGENQGQDAIITLKYYINGQQEPYIPQHTLRSGTHLLHMFYVWESFIRIDISTLKVTITCNNASIHIEANEGCGRIMQSGDAYVEESNNLEYIDIGHYPNKMLYLLNERIDYTGLVVNACYEDGSTEDITSQCTITPANDTQVTSAEYINVEITYTKDNVPYSTSFTMEVKSLDAIDVKKEPTKMEYFVGENIDLSGVEIEALYTDDTSDVVTQYCTFNPANGTQISQIGNVPVTVTYQEDYIIKTCIITLTAVPIELESITITPPTKTEYEKGEALDYTGVQVTAEYTDGSSRDVTSSCTFSPASGTSATMDMVSVTVSYTEGSISQSDTFDIEVYEFTGIYVDQEPTNTSYWLGDETDYSGIVVKGEYSNGDTEDVTAACTYNPANGATTISTGSNAVSVAYARPKDGHTYNTEFYIEVKEPEPILKYLQYYTDSVNRIIYVTGLNGDEISADNLRNLIIPSSYTDSDSGVTYTVVLGMV